jgi:hypothetical protein
MFPKTFECGIVEQYGLSVILLLILLCVKFKIFILLARNAGSHPIEFDSLVGEKFLCKAFDVAAKHKGNKRCK